MFLLAFSQKPSQVDYTSYNALASGTKYHRSKACENAKFSTENTVTPTINAQKATNARFAPGGKLPYIQFPHPPRPPTPGPQPRPGPLGPRPPEPTPPPSPRRRDAGSVTARLAAISVLDIRKLLIAALSPDHSETSEGDCSGQGSIPGRLFRFLYLAAFQALASAAGSGLPTPRFRCLSSVPHSPLGIVGTAPTPLVAPAAKHTVLVC
ncbi:hypothetical protein PG999_000081 [Apiospora kogelbergensis]|uniref:Uncharacterized protein n=1 Tax=Apiospora kogelbergensis TaxID=1337665 RepID=A0AAW0RAP9_9PEZI